MTHHLATSLALIPLALLGDSLFAGVRPNLVFERTDGNGYVSRGPEARLHFGPAGVDFPSVGLRMELAGKARRVGPTSAEPLPGKVNYLVGSRTAWKTDVTAYGRLRYSGVYDGVDLVFYGRSNQLEYDFVISPHADPSAIEIQWRGAQKLALDRKGDLIVSAATETIRWRAPVLYQNARGIRKEIVGAFRLLGRNRVGFRVSHYDRNLELVIDPTLAFSTYLGGTSFDVSRGIAVDGSGNVYVAGLTKSMNLAVTSGTFQTGFAGATGEVIAGDAFVAKYNAAGALMFLTYLGGQRDDAALGLALDSSGNVYVTGFTTSRDFPTTSGAYQTNLGGVALTGSLFVLGDAFVSKLSPDGKTLIYSTYLGGSSEDGAFGIAVDAGGNAYVTGTTLSNNFPVTSAAYQNRINGSGGQSFWPATGLATLIGGDTFLTKLNPSGSALVYSTYFGGGGDDIATSIAIDAAGNAYLAGFTLSSNFPVTPGVLQATFQGVEQQNFFWNFGDAFVAKFNPAGSSLLYSTLIGGRGDDWISAIAADSSGNVYATGCTTSTNFPVTAGSPQPSYRGPNTLPFFVDHLMGDAFVLKLNPAANGLAYSTYLGGGGDDCGMALALESNGNVIVAGASNSTDFPVSQDAIQKAMAGPGYAQDHNTAGDGFIAEFSPTGARNYATYFGGSDNDAFLSVAVTSTGTAYLSGMTTSTNFPTAKAAQSSSGGTGAGAFDGMIASISGFGSTGSGGGGGGGGGGSGPQITQVLNAFSPSAVIGPNTWLRIKGTLLSATTRTWLGPDFVNNQMPTQLDGVGVTFNGKNGYIFYVDKDQINVLSPPDLAAGAVQVQVVSGANKSNIVTVQAQTYSLSLFAYDNGYVVARHANGDLLGPTTLYPGFSTPAKPDEIVVIIGDGFGPSSIPFVPGSISQGGLLPQPWPVIKIGGRTADVKFAGVVGPGQYQINVTIPSDTPDGDNDITVSYDGLSTQTGALINVHK